MRNQPVRILEPQLESPAGLCANATNIVVACQFGHSRVVMPAVTPDRCRRFRRPPAGKRAHLPHLPAPTGPHGLIFPSLKVLGSLFSAPFFRGALVGALRFQDNPPPRPTNTP